MHSSSAKIEFEEVGKYIYLGVLITNKADGEEEICWRMVKRNKCAGTLSHLIRAKNISRMWMYIQHRKNDHASIANAYAMLQMQLHIRNYKRKSCASSLKFDILFQYHKSFWNIWIKQFLFWPFAPRLVACKAPQESGVLIFCVKYVKQILYKNVIGWFFLFRCDIPSFN